MKKILNVLISLSLIILLNISAHGQRNTLANTSSNSDSSLSVHQQKTTIINEVSKEDDKINIKPQVEISFTFANWALTALALLITSFGLFTVGSYIKDKGNRRQAKVMKEEYKKQKQAIEKIHRTIMHKTEFNLEAANSIFEAMEFLSHMALLQNPEVDKGNYFLKKINENKTLLFLYHDDRDARIRALKDLYYTGTISIVNTLKKYRKSIDDKELAELADKAIDEINRREGAKGL